MSWSRTGSPFDINCKDLSQITVRGDGLYNAKIGHETHFIVDYSQGEFGHVYVQIKSPNDEDVLAAVRVKDVGIAEVSYNPPIPGTYSDGCINLGGMKCLILKSCFLHNMCTTTPITV